MPVYDPELDVVLEDASGSFLSYCIGWLNRANGFGHFEPVGCRPNFTGRGYARAVTIEGMRKMQVRGMHTALVATTSGIHALRVVLCLEQVRWHAGDITALLTPLEPYFPK